MLPKDPAMRLSVVNTKLRDFYPNLESLCEDLDIPQGELEESLKKIDYVYDPQSNQFR